MENASKALIMAGGVLISLMVIGVLVFFFNSIRNVQNINLTSEEVQQATEFNKQYDVYARDVYGSEILSIANKIADYNKRESDNKGYTPIVLEVQLKKNIDDEYFTKDTYIIPNRDDANILQSKIDAINSKVKEYASRDKNVGNIYSNKNVITISRTIAQLSNMRTNEWIELLGLKEVNIEDKDTINTIKNKINDYNQYKNIESQMKQTVFKYVKFEFDNNTGRITKMIYKLPE